MFPTVLWEMSTGVCKFWCRFCCDARFLEGIWFAWIEHEQSTYVHPEGPFFLSRSFSVFKTCSMSPTSKIQPRQKLTQSIAKMPWSMRSASGHRPNLWRPQNEPCFSNPLYSIFFVHFMELHRKQREIEFLQKFAKFFWKWMSVFSSLPSFLGWVQARSWPRSDWIEWRYAKSV